MIPSNNAIQNQVQIDMIGLEKVSKVLWDLGELQTDNVVKQSLGNAAKYLIRMGKLKLKYRMKSGFNGVTGNLMKGFTYHIKRRNRGVIAGFNKKGSHAHLVDQGTDFRHTAKGYYRGRMEGNYFWTQTRNMNVDNAKSLIMYALNQAVERIKQRNA